MGISCLRILEVIKLIGRCNIRPQSLQLEMDTTGVGKVVLRSGQALAARPGKQRSMAPLLDRFGSRIVASSNHYCPWHNTLLVESSSLIVATNRIHGGERHEHVSIVERSCQDRQYSTILPVLR